MDSEFYIQARREWDERYGDLVLGKRNCQITSAGLMLLSLILALRIVWTSARTKVIPYVVEVDKLGCAIATSTALAASPFKCSGGLSSVSALHGDDSGVGAAHARSLVAIPPGSSAVASVRGESGRGPAPMLPT